MTAVDQARAGSTWWETIRAVDGARRLRSAATALELVELLHRRRAQRHRMSGRDRRGELSDQLADEQQTDARDLRATADDLAAMAVTA